MVVKIITTIITKTIEEKRLDSPANPAIKKYINEPFIEYYPNVMKLCNIIDSNMADASKIDHFCHSLKYLLLTLSHRGFFLCEKCVHTQWKNSFSVVYEKLVHLVEGEIPFSIYKKTLTQ